MRNLLRSFLLLLALTVSGNVMATEVTFTAGTDKGTSSSQGNADTMTKDGVTISSTDAATTTAQYRFYASSTTTISYDKGTITKIVFTCTASGDEKYGPGCWTASTGDYTTNDKVGTWTGSASEVSFTSSGKQIRATSIVVTVEESATAVEKPTVTTSVSEAEEGTAFTVTFAHTNSAANIYYTTDGTTPTTESTKASGEVSLTMGNSDIVINAIAEVNGETSNAATATVTYKAPTLDGYTVITSLPYEAALTSTDKRDDFTFVQDSSVSFDVWTWNNSYGAKASAYSSQTKYASEAWVYSPVFDLTYVEDGTVTFDEAGKFFGTMSDEATFWVREGTTGEWQQLTLTNRMSGSDWNYVNVGDIDLSAYKGKKIQFGFKYVSTTDAAGTWEFKNFTVKGTVDAIDHVVTKVAVASDAVYNLAGQRVNKDYKGVVIKNGKKYINR